MRGALAGGTGPELTGPRGAPIALQGYSVRAGQAPDSLEILAPDGSSLFSADHVHVHYDATPGALELRNADVRISATLATRLGDPHLAGLAVGVLELVGAVEATASLQAQGGIQTQGGGNCLNPNFSLPVDIALIEISSVQQSAIESGRVVITPSAELENVGQADVRWEPALDPDHPMLAWALYRLDGDTFEQIGVSTTKHAFFATNVGCPCPGGEILFAGGCTDIYGVFTNEDRLNLAPRDELTASTVAWESCGSFFDTDCDDEYDVDVPANELERRMSVAIPELQVSGARYFIEAWYLVAGDIDIYNSMGWREVTPFFTGSFWSFLLQTPFAEGSAIDAWIPPGTLEARKTAARYAGSEGHFEIASHVSDLGGGLYRYEYLVMNFDLDRQLRSLAVPLPTGANATDFAFTDATETTADDWVASVAADEISWTASPGTGLDWGRMVRMAVTVDADSEVGIVVVEPLEAGAPASYSLGGAVPVPEPASGTALLGGIAVLLGLRRHRQGEA